MMIILAAFSIKNIQESHRVISNKLTGKRQKSWGGWKNSIDEHIVPALTAS